MPNGVVFSPVIKEDLNVQAKLKTLSSLLSVQQHHITMALILTTSEDGVCGLSSSKETCFFKIFFYFLSLPSLEVLSLILFPIPGLYYINISLFLLHV